MRRNVLFLMIVVSLVFLSSIYFDSEKKDMDEAARMGTSGAYVRLTDGITHYELAGDESASTIVLIHGGSVPYFIWDRTFPDLVKAGFRVLRYDLFGRGYSDRPDAVYNTELYRRQLNELLTALKIKPPANLAGVSMGAAIAADFTDHYPEKVENLCLMDPVGFPVNLPASERLMHIPLLGEYVFTLIGPRSMVSFVEKDLVNRPPPEYIAAYKSHMQFKGFRHAIISTLRNMPLNDMKAIYQNIGKTDRKILLVWGTKDTVTPFANSGNARSAMPHARFVPVEGAGHAAHFERPEIVNPALIDFFKSN